MNNIEKIALDKICELKGVTPEMVLSKSRQRDKVEARQLFMYWLKENTTHTLTTIGRMLGYRDHTTVIHSISHIKDIIHTDDAIKEIWVHLRENCHTSFTSLKHRPCQKN